MSVVASAVVALTGSSAFAQTPGPSTLPKRTLTLDSANAMVAAAVAHAKVLGIPSSVAVYDESETLKALVTMDGARFTSVNFALDKAYTAVRREAATQDLADAFASTRRAAC